MVSYCGSNLHFADNSTEHLFKGFIALHIFFFGEVVVNMFTLGCLHSFYSVM